MKFDLSELQAATGECVNFVFINEDAILHDITIDATANFSGLFLEAKANEMDSKIIRMPNNTMSLEFYCSVPGHRAAGMKGTFIIAESVSVTSSTSNTSSTSSTSKSTSSSESQESSFVSGIFFSLSFLIGVCIFVRKTKK